MSTETHPAVSDAMREAVAPYIALFDVAYRKACEGSMEPDWCNAALLGQQMRNAFFKAIGPDGPIASEIARLTGERDAALERADWLADIIIRALRTIVRPSAISNSSFWSGYLEEERYRQCEIERISVSRTEAAEAETARLRAALEDAADALGWAASALREDINDAAAGVTLSAANNASAALTSQEQADV